MKQEEFQAIVLAGGKGSRMLDLTHSKAKCFLPVGNYPMVWFPLRLLQSIGFQDVIVVTQDWAKEEMAKLPKQYGLDLNLDIVTCSSHEDLGTADALRLVHSRLTAENIMVVSSDLLVDINQIRHLTDLHRVHRSSVTALFAPTSVESKQVQVPGPKTKLKTEKDLVGIDGTNGQLCFLSSEADLNEVITVKRSLLKEHPHIKVHSNLLDAHFYIFRKWVADFVFNDRDFTAIKGELLPFLVRRQFRRIRDNKQEQMIEDETSSVKPTSSGNHDPEIYIRPDMMALQAQALSSWNDHSGDMKGAYRNRLLRCYAFVMDRAGTCIRANNLVSYCEVNRQIEQLWPLLVTEKEIVNKHPTASIQAKAVIGPECLVGEESKISDKTTIKNCIIGSYCVVEEKVKLTNCIIMDKVTVKSGSNVQGSLLCDDVTIKERADVKDSIVGHGQVVHAEAQIANEVVFEDDSQMYI